MVTQISFLHSYAFTHSDMMPKPYLLKFVKLNITKVASAKSCAALMLIRIFGAE
jgi:hypothetical protein